MITKKEMNENFEDKEIELRMYFFVPYNISEIQKGIQCGHAALEYAYRFGQDQNFIDFVQQHKTWIILNGGTTNDERDLNDNAVGTLNQIGDALAENNVKFSFFREPDLNYALTALCFIVDERVFNKKDYPDFKDFIEMKMNGQTKEFLKGISENDYKNMYPDYYKEWIRLIGGIENEFLRELVKDKKLA